MDATHASLKIQDICDELKQLTSCPSSRELLFAVF